MDAFTKSALAARKPGLVETPMHDVTKYCPHIGGTDDRLTQYTLAKNVNKLSKSRLWMCKKERPKNHPAHQPYDTTILCERSRSPSPASLLQELRDRDHTRRKYRNGMGPPGHVQHSYPVLVTRRQGQGRRLPPTPCKPSTLQLQQTNINFPKLNASPTHTLHSAHTTPHSVHSLPPSREFLREHHQHHHLHGGGGGPREHHHHHQHQHRDLYYRERDRERDRERYRSSRSERITDAMEHHVPLSYEQALAMGRSGGRVLPSPILNGYKPKGGGGGGGGGSAIGLHSSRHSDSDDEDWC
ncbi:hypothetical protein pipiens_010254 [Culex pipiens pipiens]|uniref:Uncharacterized protein n=1 Tax=Culex pipiens pipiens TaxID=38569 RepID=A0ABD1DCK6_CULPP